MTEKQKLQKARAYFKFVLTGLPKPINLNYLGPAEKSAWNEILLIRNQLLNEFDWNSKRLGLNVPEHKCWCNKPAKIQIVNYEGELIWVCNKHNKE